MSPRADVFENLLRGAIASVFLSIAVLANAHAGNEASPAEQSSSGAVVFAKVGDREITVDQYNQAYDRAVRQRFYHSKPPEAELAAVRQEIADQLITRELLLLEAERTGMKPDQQNIEATLEQYDQRYANSPRWQEQRASLLGALKVKLEQDDLVRQMENKARNVAQPDEKALKRYYEQNLDKFTEPAQMKYPFPSAVA